MLLMTLGVTSAYVFDKIQVTFYRKYVLRVVFSLNDLKITDFRSNLY